MKKQLRRIISLVLSVVMAFQISSTALVAFADDESVEPYEQIGDVSLADDVEDNSDTAYNENADSEDNVIGNVAAEKADEADEDEADEPEEAQLQNEQSDSADELIHQIDLPVPEALRDGNYFFISQGNFTISEKSNEKLYIPIQRTGDLSGEAEVTLKLVDMTSHYGVNYTAEIKDEDIEPFKMFGDISLVDIIKDNPDTTYEAVEVSENELGQMIHDAGGMAILDSEENVIGNVTATKAGEEEEPSQSGDAELQEEQPATTDATVDETSDDAAEEPQPEENEAVEENEAAEESAAEEEPATGDEEFSLVDPTNPLKTARNQYTGTISDRQEMLPSAMEKSAEQDREEQADLQAEDEAPLFKEEYPGSEYRLHFDANESVKYLVITPKYSKKAEGDSTLFCMLEKPTGGVVLDENTYMSYVNITDEDELEDIVVSMAESVVYAENGKATIKVKRSGGINNLVQVHVYTLAGSAETGKDFSGVGAQVYFSMGLEERTFEIPVGHGKESKNFM